MADFMQILFKQLRMSQQKPIIYSIVDMTSQNNIVWIANREMSYHMR